MTHGGILQSIFSTGVAAKLEQLWKRYSMESSTWSGLQSHQLPLSCSTAYDDLTSSLVMRGTMIFTGEILRQVIAFAILKTSKSLGIVDVHENDLPDNAIELIAQTTGHRDALEEFVAAYEAWYKFHLRIYKADKSGRLSTSENDELTRLINRRDAARKALQQITG